MISFRRWFYAASLVTLVFAAPAFANPIVEDADPNPGPGTEVDGKPATKPGTWNLLLDPDEAPPPPSTQPSARLLHTAIFDAANNRMVMAGGVAGAAFSDVWTMDLSGPGHEWTELTPIGTMGERRDHSAIYDPVRQRMVVFGGSGYFNSFMNDVLQLSLTGVPTWSTVPTVGAPPPARFSHTAMYDPVRDRMIVFGGYTGVFRNDTWQLDFTTSPATWSQISATGPSVRNAMTAVYDPIGDRMLVFGGFGNDAFRGDLWALSLSGAPAWTQITQTGQVPSERRHYSAAVDPTRNRLIINGGLRFGPGNTLEHLTDTYVLSFTTMSWTQIPITGPRPRNGHRAVYTPLLDEFVEFGGYGEIDSNEEGYFNDSWRIVNPASPSWVEITSSPPSGGDAPSPRRDHTAVIDNGSNMVVFGGFDGDFLNDTWTLDMNAAPAWFEVATAGPLPPARFAHTSLWDPVNNRMLVFGGFDGTFRNDLWQLDFDGTPTWSQLTPAGTPPVGRNAMTAVYDEPRRRLVVFGGFDGNNFLNDVWALNLDGAPVWSNITPGGGKAPAARRHYAAIYDPDREALIISGGYDLTYRDDSWELDLSKNKIKWVRINAKKTLPPGRNSHRGVLDPGRHAFVIFGGYGGSNEAPNYLNDSWSLSLENKEKWSKIEPTGDIPIARLLHTAVFDVANDRLLMFGGLDGGNLLNDLWELTFESSAPALRQAEVLASSGPARPVDFALHGSYPNPAYGAFHVSFSLPGSQTAELSIYSVNGRRVATRDISSFGRGRHVIRFAERFAPGVYWVRLTQAGRTATTKTAILQ